jgi:MFS family permease
VNFRIAGVWLHDRPELSWRVIFLAGLIPAAVALLVRKFVREPERWKAVAGAVPSLGELFRGDTLKLTLSGLGTAIVALVMWWSCNAFIPLVANGLAGVEAKLQGLEPAAAQGLKEAWKATATNAFNIGGLIGTLLTVPLAKMAGRKAMFGLYFAGSGLAILAAFGLDIAPHTRLLMYFPIGLTVFGVFGSFTYYLPELYPTRLRATGAGFCYNAGRVFAAVGPFVVGGIASRGADALGSALQVLFWVGIVPLVGLLLVPFIVETRDRALAD